MSKLTQNHKVQLTVALIGAVAIMVAAISGPLVSYFFNGNTQSPTPIKANLEEQEPRIPRSSNESQVSGDEPEPDRSKSPAAVKPAPAFLDHSASTKSSASQPLPKNSVDTGTPELVFTQKDDTSPLGWSNPVVVTVFQRQVFNLCGYQGFTAEIDPGPYGGQELKIESLNRDIPGRDFRGFRRSVDAEAWVLLWPACQAEFKIVKSTSTVRITVSYQRR